MSPRRLTAFLAMVFGSLACATAAGATAVPGATYTGSAADGARIKFTISADGKLVNSYQFVGVQAATCQFYSNGMAPEWPGAPIANNAFSYQLIRSGIETSIWFNGTFPGPQSASGTFELRQDATNQNPACDTGTVSWTATTTATPGGSGGSGGSGSGGSGSGGSGSGSGGGHGRKFKTRVTLRRASARQLTGRIMSPAGACRAGRKVILWRGKRRIASTKAKAGGKFSFARSQRIRGRFVRASAPTRRVRAGSCAAASSKLIRG